MASPIFQYEEHERTVQTLVRILIAEGKMYACEAQRMARIITAELAAKDSRLSAKEGKL